MGAKSIVFLSILVALATSHAQEPKVPCCYPDQFVTTFDTELGISSFGQPSAAFVYATAAFDFTNKRQGDNGTLFIYGQPPQDYAIIRDYLQGVQYTIDRGLMKCDKIKLEGPMQNCVPAGFTYNTTQYLGDKQLYTKSYFYHTLTPQQHGQAVVTVSQSGCLLVGFRSIETTQQASSLSHTGISDYVEGIADPDSFFDVPKYCPSYITEEPKLLEQLNYLRLPF